MTQPMATGPGLSFFVFSISPTRGSLPQYIRPTHGSSSFLNISNPICLLNHKLMLQKISFENRFVCFLKVFLRIIASFYSFEEKQNMKANKLFHLIFNFLRKENKKKIILIYSIKSMLVFHFTL
jgi:hypothetical protein